jgi:glycosyltransferase involved in cell wall biosynthesis
VSRAPRYAWVLSGRYEAPQDNGPRAEFEVFVADYGAELFSLSTLDRPAYGRVFMQRLRLARYVQSRAQKFDAIIASGEDIGILLALASVFGRAKTPIHMLFHGHHLESRKLRVLAPLLRRMRHVHFHCLSTALRERTMQVLGLPEGRCHATGHGVDKNYFDAVLTGDEILIASAGAANRDYVTLAAAVTDVFAPVKIAADSAWVAPDAGLAAGAWPGNIEIRSYGSYENLRALYAQARFVVVPLHPAAHACGYAVIAEAMAMGRAVIATRTAAPPDFLQDGVTGFLVPAHDAARLRAQILLLLEHPETAMDLGRQARALISTFNSLEAFCARLEAIVRHSIGPKISQPQAALNVGYREPENIL